MTAAAVYWKPREFIDMPVNAFPMFEEGILFCDVTLPHPKGSGGFPKGKTLDFWAPGKLHNFDLCCFDVLTCEFSGFLAVTILTLVGNNVKIAT